MENGRAIAIATNPAVVIAVVAIALRLIIAPILTQNYDIAHWAQVIENIQTGDGLYGIDAYYYTPTWGYFLGFETGFMDLFLNIGNFGERITALLPLEDLGFRFHTATTVTIAFAVWMKIPLIIIDVIVAYLIYRTVKTDTGDENRATFAMAIWMLFPIVIYMSGIQAQFDCISALMILLVFLLVRKDHTLLAGMMFGACVLLKFFPAFTILVLLCYVIVKHKNDGKMGILVGKAIAGTILMVVLLYLPVLGSGELANSLTFILERANRDATMSLVQAVVTMLAVFGTFLFGYLMYKTDRKDIDRRLPVYMLMAMIFALTMSPNPQYVLVIIPFLAIIAVEQDGKMRIPLIILAIGTLLTAVSNNNVMILDGISAYAGVVSPEWIVSVANMLDTIVINMPFTNLLGYAGMAVQYIGLAATILILGQTVISERFPRLGTMILGLKGWTFE